jgi:hypothetical protein
MRDSPDGSTDSDGRGCFRTTDLSRVKQLQAQHTSAWASGRWPSLPRPMDSGEHVGHSALARSGSATGGGLALLHVAQSGSEPQPQFARPLARKQAGATWCSQVIALMAIHAGRGVWSDLCRTRRCG